MVRHYEPGWGICGDNRRILFMGNGLQVALGGGYLNIFLTGWLGFFKL